MSNMNFKENKYTLQFDFKIDDVMEPVQFMDPEDVIVAHRLSEIDDCIQKIEQVVQSGKYVAGDISYEATYAFRENVTKQITNKMPLLWYGVFNEYSKLPVRKKGHYKISKWTMEESKSTYMKHFHNIMNEM